MRFIKMHGLGNDYVYVNGFEEAVADPAALAPRIADRHFGVGGDGLILVLPPQPGVDAHVRMRMFNSDGSEAEMCGNGVRCVCKLAHDHGITTANPMRVQTGAGVLSLRYELGADGNVAEVTVNMGAPVLEAGRIPVAIPGVDAGVQVLDVPGPSDACPGPEQAQRMGDAGVQPRMTCVSMGNPHAVIYCADVAGVPLEAIGPILEFHPWFPRRINVHFVEVRARDEVTMRTWERGSGITLACGTGAAAVCVAGVLTGRTDRAITAHLPGGDLKLHWHDPQQGGHVDMAGPATEVFIGDWPA
ncbi:MAG: diaminopimelate epimerase [Phycisphaeraceae bacterium]